MRSIRLQTEFLLITKLTLNERTVKDKIKTGKICRKCLWCVYKGLKYICIFKYK